MAKGSQLKIEVGNQIIELFGENAFWNGEGKEIRINGTENGNELQIKVALTAAKDIVEPGADNALPTPITKGGSVKAGEFSFPEPQKIEVTDNEKTAVQDLMSSLGL